MLPSCGVELVYGTVGINKHIGFWSTWLILAAWLAVPAAGMMGIISWFNYIAGWNLSITSITLIAAGFITLYLILSLYEIKLAGQIQTFMLFFALAVCSITAIIFWPPAPGAFPTSLPSSAHWGMRGNGADSASWSAGPC